VTSWLSSFPSPTPPTELRHRLDPRTITPLRNAATEILSCLLGLEPFTSRVTPIEGRRCFNPHRIVAPPPNNRHGRQATGDSVNERGRGESERTPLRSDRGFPAHRCRPPPRCPGHRSTSPAAASGHRPEACRCARACDAPSGCSRSKLRPAHPAIARAIRHRELIRTVFQWALATALHDPTFIDAPESRQLRANFLSTRGTTGERAPARPLSRTNKSLARSLYAVECPPANVKLRFSLSACLWPGREWKAPKPRPVMEERPLCVPLRVGRTTGSVPTYYARYSTQTNTRLQAGSPHQPTMCSRP